MNQHDTEGGNVRKPVTFRPTEQDNEALNIVAADFPTDTNSMTNLIRKALIEYARRGSTESRFQRIEGRLDRLESKDLDSQREVSA